MDNKEKKLEVLNVDNSLYITRISKEYRERKAYKPVDKRNIMCYIPGTIVELLVKEGDMVKKGDAILVLEAMKMQNRIKSFMNGKVAEIFVKEGERVAKGVLLIRFE